jgi:K+-sensing histidine kinase KdpD
LISNAKYSDKNTKLAIITTDDDDKIECSIIDSGIGIASKDISKVLINFSDLMQQIILKLKEQVGFVNSQKLCLLLTIDVQISSQESVGTAVTLSHKEDLK